MQNRDLILKLVDNSTNAFGQLIGLTEEEKLKKALSITESTILETFKFDSSTLTQKKLAEILSKNTFDLEQAQQLTNLFWTQAELLIKLNKQDQSVIHYKNALEILHWKSKQSEAKGVSERKDKITELESIIESFKTTEVPNYIH
jgi:aspartyl/asparaginyl-tRNA synthetase